MDPARTHNRKPNRLIDETSPYLLQHARNPVDWYPWGDEAFQKARELDRPVFLSVGYSACHWCHVMERESFENETLAHYLYEHDISVKVDRAERPDGDQIYLAAVQLMTHRGGWPMSVFMTPDKEPFYGGTYWPPTSRMGMPGFLDILQKLNEIWTQRRDEISSSTGRLVAAMHRVCSPVYEQQELSTDLLRRAMQQLLASADRSRGGFGSAPKFPHPMDLRLLLRCWQRFGENEALDIARLTLDRMAAGGIYDHLGGGFHRYSTDEQWLVPHFEKMLYDNALLVPAYLEAWQIGHESPADTVDYERVVRETLDYVLREMTQPYGGFYSTQDADSEGVEGKFFVWTEEEILDILGSEEGHIFNDAYDVSPRGNWEGRTILNRPRTDQQTARMLGITVQSLRDTLHRVAPARDEKVLTGWNGLMITAMAMAGRILGEPRYLAAARTAADFLLSQVRSDDGRLLHSFKDGQARFAAYLDDYACLIDGLVELYQATFEPAHLDQAVRLADEMIAHFSDPSGGFYYTADDHESLLTRPKDVQDSATPSGNSMAATALLKLGRLSGRTDLEQAGFETLRAMSGLLSEHPRAAAQALIATDLFVGPTFELLLVDGDNRDAGDQLLGTLARHFLPNTLLLRKSPSGSIPAGLDERFASLPRTEKPQIFPCQRGSCLAPLQDPDELVRQVKTPACS